MSVVALDPASGLARCVDDGGAASDVEVALVGEVDAGDRLLVHAGTAIARIGSEVLA